MAEGGTLADVYVNVRGKTETLKEDVQKGGEEAGKQGEEAGKKWSSGFLGQVTKLATSIIATFAVFEAVDFVKEAVAGAREASKEQRVLAQVIKTTGGAAGVTAEQVQQLTEELASVTGVSAETIAAGANVALTFTSIKNRAGEGNDIFTRYLETALDVSTALHEDLQPSIIQVGKALNDPITGMKQLRRVGVSFTQAQIDQATHLEKTGHLMEAQKIILDELSKEFGGAAKAAASPASLAAASWDRLKVELGTKLLPAITDISNAFLKLLPVITPIIGAIADVIATVSTFLANNKTIAIVILAAAGALVLLSSAISAVKAVHEAWLVVTLAEDAALDANPIGIIIIAVAALAAGIIWVATKTRFFQTIWGAVWGFLKAVGAWFAGPFAGFFVGAWNKIVGLWNSAVAIGVAVVLKIISIWRGVVDFFTSLPGKIWAGLSALPGILWNSFKGGVDRVLFLIGYFTGLVILAFERLPGTIWGLITSLWNKAVALTRFGITVLITGLEQLPSRAKALIGELWSWIVGRFEAGWHMAVNAVVSLKNRAISEFNTLKAEVIHAATALVTGFIHEILALPGQAQSAAGHVKNAVIGALSGAGSWLLSAGHDLIFGLIHGIEGAVSAAIGAVKHAVGQIVNGAKSALGISSPSKVFAEIGKQSIAGYVQPWATAAPALGRFVGGLTIPGQGGSTTTNTVQFSPTYNVPNPINAGQLATMTMQQLAYALSTGAIGGR